MAITFDNVSAENISNPVTSQTTSFTVGSGDNRFLYIWVLGNVGASSGITSVTYAGDALTKLGSSVLAPDGRSFDVWYMVNPDSGANNVVISRSGSGVIFSGFASYAGVDQTTPIVNNSSSTKGSSSTTYASSVTISTASSWAIAAVRDGAGRTLTPDAGTTERLDGSSMGGHLLDSGGAAGVGTYNFGGTWNSTVTDATIMYELVSDGVGDGGGATPFSQSVVIL